MDYEKKFKKPCKKCGRMAEFKEFGGVFLPYEFDSDIAHNCKLVTDNQGQQKKKEKNGSLEDF